MPSALVIEDELGISRPLCECFEDLGYDATAVATLAEARAVIAMNRFDVVVLDWMLHGETSEPLLAMLAEGPHATPTVFFSADQRARAIAEQWSITFVLKPFDLDALMHAIVDTRTAGRAPRQPA